MPEITLTPEQTAFIAFGETPEVGATGEPLSDLLVYAVAGAGKTETLVRKIKRLIDRGVNPRKILLTTFSKRGSADMRRRMAALGVHRGVEARTLHSLAWQVIRTSPELKRDPALPPKWAQTGIVQRELKRYARENFKEAGALPKPAEVNQEIGLAKASLIWPGTNADGPWFGPWTDVRGKRYPAYVEWATTREREPIDAETAAIVERCYKAIEDTFAAPEAAKKWDSKRMRWLDDPMFKELPAISERGRMIGRTRIRFVTFDDMIALLARSMAQDAPFVRTRKGEFCNVFVDECQDNSEGQWIMARYLASKSLCVVGDDMQAIFGFRGARPDLMRAFSEGPRTKVQPLSLNFRCGQAILDAANNLLDHAGDRLYKGKLVCGRGADKAPGKVECEFYGDAGQEAAKIIGEIQAAINEGASPDDIALLYRINAQSGPLEVEAIKRGLAYKVAGRSFFRRPEIEAAVGYLAAALDEGDERGWRACANVPSRMLGNVFFQVNPSLTKARAALASSELGGPGRGFWKDGVLAAIRVVEGVKERLADPALGVPDALRYVFEECGVRRFFREDGADDETETDVDEACSALVSCAAAVADATKLLAYARGMARVGHEDAGEHEGERTAEPRITLSTVHKAKGLEWKRVHVVGFNEGLFPFFSADIEEERRLAYVAITRARDYLKVSGAKLRGDGKPASPSCFVRQAKLLPDEALDALETAHPDPVAEGEAVAAETPEPGPESDAHGA